MMDKPVETPIEELLRRFCLSDGWETVSERGFGLQAETRHHGDLMERAAEELSRLREELKYAEAEAARFRRR